MVLHDMLLMMMKLYLALFCPLLAFWALGYVCDR